MGAVLLHSIRELRGWLASRPQPIVGLVPTMGALHAGHRSLIQQARRECGMVVVSIFVNPLQFDREDDLARYPRTLESDVAACNAEGVDLVFSPEVAEIYPAPPLCTIDVGTLADHLCGPRRPGHFQGVATIVMKLFQIVQPDRAYFGQKDAQQLAIVRRLVADFNVPSVVVGMPTAREPDGLALSSRNRHLNARERTLALSLYQALSHAALQISRGVVGAQAIASAAAACIPADESLRLEYLEIVHPDLMQPVDVVTAPVCVAGALWVGATRLIDNILCTPPPRTD